MIRKPNLCYVMQRKKDKIIEYKKSLGILLKYLYSGYFALGLVLIVLAVNSDHFQIDFSDKLFPYLQKSDLALLYLGLFIGMFLFVLSGRYNRLKSKYELLRHDIIKDLDSTTNTKKICLCKEECDCREQFIRDMDRLEIDIIFKKYKTESKYTQ